MKYLGHVFFKLYRAYDARAILYSRHYTGIKSVTQGVLAQIYIYLFARYWFYKQRMVFIYKKM